jgi:tellurite resistance protein
MEFTNLEKSAIIRVLTDIMLADGVIDPGEKSYLIQIFGVLNTNKTISIRIYST